MQREVLIRFARVLLLVICNMFRKKLYFRLSTFDRGVFFRAELVT